MYVFCKYRYVNVFVYIYIHMYVLRYHLCILYRLFYWFLLQMRPTIFCHRCILFVSTGTAGDLARDCRAACTHLPVWSCSKVRCTDDISRLCMCVGFCWNSLQCGGTNFCAGVGLCDACDGGMSLVTHVLQCAAVCCSVLQCAAVCCSVLQCVAVCCSVLQYVAPESSQEHKRVRLLKCVAVYCSVLQCVAVCCSVLQCVAVCCSV